MELIENKKDRTVELKFSEEEKKALNKVKETVVFAYVKSSLIINSYGWADIVIIEDEEIKNQLCVLSTVLTYFLKKNCKLEE